MVHKGVMNVPSDDQITPELEADFRRRAAAFRDFVRRNPEAAIEELVAFRQRIRPKDPQLAKMFTRWSLNQMNQELSRSGRPREYVR